MDNRGSSQLTQSKKPKPQIFRFMSRDGSYERTSASLWQKLLHLKTCWQYLTCSFSFY